MDINRRMRGGKGAAALLALLWALGLLLTGAGAEAEEKAPATGCVRCLAVGVDRFVSMPPTEPVSANNVETVGALLADFLPGEGFCFQGAVNPASVEAFEALVQEAFCGAGERDLCLLYLSTHGVVVPEAGVALLLSDGAREEKLTPGQLRTLLDRFPGRKVLIVDACHSGAMIGQGAGSGENAFDDAAWRVLVSSAAEEESWFFDAEGDGYAGAGYFTAALANALRGSDREQIDPNGDGAVSLNELTARLRDIHGISTVCCFPEEDETPLFLLPEDRRPGDRLQGLAFGEVRREDESLTLPVHFRAGEAVRLIYMLIPSRGGRWDFEHAVKLPDREKTGLVRGLLSPGEKDRSLRLTLKSLGEEGRALMQIISLRGENRSPAAEAGRVIVLPGE